MSNILSQDEIDELLGAMERGEIDLENEGGEGSGSKRIENYNFRRPNLISREKLRGFNSMHEQLARQMQTSLQLLMRSKVEVSVASVDQIVYQEYIKTMGQISHLLLFSMEPLPGSAIFEVKLPLAYGIVDMLLGGKGDVETEVRMMTEIETAIFEPFVNNVNEQIEGVWSEVVRGIGHKVMRYESDPEMIQSAPAEAPMVVVSFVVKAGNANGVLNVGYPLPMVQSLLSSVDSKNWENSNYYGKTIPKDYRRDILNCVAEVNVILQAELGRVDLTSGEFHSLSEGDVLILDRKYSELLELKVG